MSLGSILLLAALGLAITYGLLGVINMAHGEMLMLGAYSTYVVQLLFQRLAPEWLALYPLLALPVAFCVSAAIGMALERTVIRHLYGRPLETLLATWGISLVLIQLVRMLFGAQNVEVANPAWLSGGIQVLPNLVLPWNRIVIIGFALFVLLLTWLLLNRTRLGLKVSHYPYVSADNRLDVEAMLAGLERIPQGDVVLLHACCHNPTGFDLSHDDWRRVLDVVRRRELLPLIDFAYQGFGDGLEEDAWAVRLFAGELPEVLITSSCSKNFGLYRDRVGALIVCAQNAEKLTDLRSQLAFLARNLWSTPPAHGAEVVAAILGDSELKGLWQEEVEGMRSRIASLRIGLVEALAPHGLAERFAHVGAQRGMFSYTGLSPQQVARLRDEHAVYLVSSGRANVAGLDARRLDRLAQAIAQVCAD
ncbi:aminotransferase class I/II-fold pyridoxal phosphate-dependent enzyme [Pseudomonas aeruginosa]|nr:aminotransferase class I/II-fold pyridoxal phosphate-dependent enzyme [Pseudomonas aeruginosa]